MAKILCVDDEPAVLTLKCAVLEGAGHTVTPAISANDAVEKLRRNSFDAVITDWRLGKASGSAVVEAAKARSNTPVVVVSGYVTEAIKSAAPPADLYLEKPVSPGELVAVIDSLLKGGTTPVRR